MSLSLFQSSVPSFIHGLKNLSAILEKAEAYATTKKIDPSVLINARLAPDMFPLGRQVQIVTDLAKGCAARLSGTDIPSFPDVETTFLELRNRIEKTIAFLQSVSQQVIDASETREIILKVGSYEMTFNGVTYLFSFVIPNFYFHSTVVYSILRHNGLDLGKKDFLGAI